MTRKKQKQTLAAGTMFGVDDLPLFSGTPATASDSPFMPEAAPEPDAPTVDMFDDETWHLINFETGHTTLATGPHLGYTRVDVATYRKFAWLRDKGAAAYHHEPASFAVASQQEMNGILRLFASDTTAVLLDTGAGYSLHNDEHVVAYVYVEPAVPYRCLERDEHGRAWLWACRVEVDSLESFVRAYLDQDRLSGRDLDEWVALAEMDFKGDKFYWIHADASTTGQTVAYFDPRYEWV
jgi:hypothetical protein